jgi:hypothetical protein
MKEVFHFAHKHQLKYPIDSKIIHDFIKCNPEYFETYELIGQYDADQNKKVEALNFFKLALTKEITTVQDKEEILAAIKKLSATEPTK